MKKRLLTFGILLLILVFSLGLTWAAEEPPLNNYQIIRLTELDMGDQIIITKIKTAKKVKFNTSTEGLAELKQSGVSRAVIKAMLERSESNLTPGSNHSGASLQQVIALVAKEGTFEIAPIPGQFKSVTIPMFGFRRFVEFPPDASATRVKDHHPSVRLNADSEPHEALWLVKLKPWTEKRVLVLDILSPSIWQGGATSNNPDDDCIIPYTAIEEKPGVWLITPKDELKPGDYGLFRWSRSNAFRPLLVGFGIDK